MGGQIRDEGNHPIDGNSARKQTHCVFRWRRRFDGIRNPRLSQCERSLERKAQDGTVAGTARITYIF